MHGSPFSLADKRNGRRPEPGLPSQRQQDGGKSSVGKVRIDGQSGVMTVELKDIADEVLYSVDLTPQNGASPA